MSDSIIVRVDLGSYDFLRPADKQTAVHVQIPEVARATYMLPAERYDGLKDRAWPEVLDVAEEHYAQGWAVTDSSSAAARAVVKAWLLEDANRDEMQAAFEEDHLRRDPVARKLLKENEQLRDRAAGLEAGLPAMQEALLKALDRIAELEAVQGTVYRASHDSFPLNLYRTREAAQKHCETELRRKSPGWAFAWGEEKDGVQDLELHADGGFNDWSGYVVTALEVASEYDEGADE